MSNSKDKVEIINKEWGELMDTLGEMAALEVACENNGVDSQWFWDNCHLLLKIEERSTTVMADLFCELTEELFVKCEELTQKDARIKELEEREKKLARCLDEIETDSEISESDYKDAYLHVKEIARKTLKELGINNE